jgi:hypothetical protein
VRVGGADAVQRVIMRCICICAQRKMASEFY